MAEETEEQQQQAREIADDAAVGRIVRTTFRDMVASFFSGKQGMVIIGLSLLTAGREGWHAMEDQAAPQAKEMAKLEHTLTEVSNNVLDVKVTVKALLDTMPQGQRDRANALIRDRMDVLAEARRQVGARVDQ